MIRCPSLFRARGKLAVLAVMGTVPVVLSIAAAPAFAEHAAGSATRRAIGAVLIPNSLSQLGARLGTVELSSKGPFALAYIRGSKELDSAWVLVHEQHGRWKSVSVISDQGLKCDQAPQAVIQDLHLLRYADGGKCSGPFRNPPTSTSDSCRVLPASATVLNQVEAAFRAGSSYDPAARLPSDFKLQQQGTFEVGSCGSTRWAVASFTAVSTRGLSNSQINGLQDRGSIFEQRASRNWTELDLGPVCGGSTGLPSQLGKLLDACNG